MIYKKIRAKHKFVNKYSTKKRAHLYCKWASFKFSILSSRFVILFTVVLPRHSSISFSNVNPQPRLTLIIDYMIIFKFHVHMERKFQLGLFKLWLNVCSVSRDDVFEYNRNSIFTLLPLTMEMKSYHGLMSWNFILGLKSWYKQPTRWSFLRKWLTHFSPVSHFYTPWKCQKTKGFPMV